MSYAVPASDDDTDNANIDDNTIEKDNRFFDHPPYRHPDPRRKRARISSFRAQVLSSSVTSSSSAFTSNPTTFSSSSSSSSSYPNHNTLRSSNTSGNGNGNSNSNTSPSSSSSSSPDLPPTRTSSPVKRHELCNNRGLTLKFVDEYDQRLEQPHSIPRQPPTIEEDADYTEADQSNAIEPPRSPSSPRTPSTTGSPSTPSPPPTNTTTNTQPPPPPSRRVSFPNPPGTIYRIKRHRKANIPAPHTCCRQVKCRCPGVARPYKTNMYDWRWEQVGLGACGEMGFRT